MARKTTLDIEQDIFDIVEPFFTGKVSGATYKSGTRPLDSTLEDVVVCEPTASPGQFQSGVFKVLVFVPCIDNGSGHPQPDKARLSEIAALEDELLNTMSEATNDYVFDLLTATSTAQYPNALENFVVFNFHFSRESL